MAEQTIEHWWNGYWGRLARRDLYLLRLADGRPAMRVVFWPWDETFPYITQARVREDIEILTRTNGDWRRVGAGL